MDRTEAPSPERVRAARAQGYLAVSHVLVGAVSMAAGVAALVVTAAESEAVLRAQCAAWLARAPGADAPGLSLAAVISPLARVVSWPALSAALAAVLVALAQTRFWLSWRGLAPRVTRSERASLAARIGSAATVVTVARALVAALVIGVLMGRLAFDHAADIVHLAARPAGSLLAPAAALAGEYVLVYGAAVVFGLAALDYAWTRYAHRRALRVSPAVRRREQREHAPHPGIAAERRRARRGMDAPERVFEPRVVVLFDGESALILTYDPRLMRAPRVTGFCHGAHALALADRARARGVPVYRDRALLRSLSALPAGGEIPRALHAIAARVLAITAPAARPGEPA